MMKKFAFLLAIVAVFAMSAAAFATDGDISAIDDPDMEKNNGWLGGSGTSRSASVYYLKGADALSLDLGLRITLEGTGSVWTGATTDAPGAAVFCRQGMQESFSPGQNILFEIGGWSAIPEKFTLSKMMSWGSGASAVEPTSGKSGDVTFTAKPIEIALSADGAARTACTAYIDSAVDEKFALSYDKTLLISLASASGNIKVGAISTGSSIASADVTGADKAIEGLTLGFDDTDLQLTVAGTAKEEGSVKLALYLDGLNAMMGGLKLDEDGSGSIDAKDPLLATPTSLDMTTYYHIFATFDLVARKTPAQEVIDDIIALDANTAVSADIAAEIASGRHSFLLVMDGSKVISLNGRSEDITPLSDDADSVAMKMVFLSADAVGKLIEWEDAPDCVELVISDDLGADATRSFDIMSGNELVQAPIKVDHGVVDLTVKNSSAPNGGYTINVKAANMIAGSSVSVAAKPTAGDLLAQQKITVARSVEGGSSSSGACTAGFGLAAIAALAMIKRRQK